MNARSKWLNEYRAARAAVTLWRFMDRKRCTVSPFPSFCASALKRAGYDYIQRNSGDMLGFCASLGVRELHDLRIAHLRRLKVSLPATTEESSAVGAGTDNARGAA